MHDIGPVQVQPSWGNVTITIAGLTNTYSSYVTTFEEYQAQRYEGASTIFGPHTLDAYIQVTSLRPHPLSPPLPPPLPLPHPFLSSSLHSILGAVETGAHWRSICAILHLSHTCIGVRWEQ